VAASLAQSARKFERLEPMTERRLCQAQPTEVNQKPRFGGVSFLDDQNEIAPCVPSLPT
jgi:hypothetical protein